MSATVPELSAGESWLWTANDRFKARAHTRGAWATVAAALAHAALFVLWPSWDVPEMAPEPGPERTELEWIALAEGAGGLVGASATAFRVDEDPDPLPEVEDQGNAVELLSAWEVAGLSEALRDRLLSRPMPVPTLAEPEVQTAASSPSQAQGDPSLPGGGDPTAAELQQLAEVDALELERLAALRPELALLAPSTWILVRNPTEVLEFMKDRFGDDGRDTSDGASLSVAIWIDETGSVEWAEIHQSSGRSDLDELALEFFSEVVSFHPARDQGARVPVSAIFWLNLPW